MTHWTSKLIIGSFSSLHSKSLIGQLLSDLILNVWFSVDKHKRQYKGPLNSENVFDLHKDNLVSSQFRETIKILHVNANALSKNMFNLQRTIKPIPVCWITIWRTLLLNVNLSTKYRFILFARLWMQTPKVSEDGPILVRSHWEYLIFCGWKPMSI